MLVEPNKVQNILSRIFQIDVRHYYSAVVSWSCDTKLGTAAPVLCFFPVRTINTRLLLTHAYAPFVDLAVIHCGCAWWVTFRYRTVSELHNSSQTLRCVVFFSWMRLLHPHCLQCTNTGGIPPHTIAALHLKVPFRRIVCVPKRISTTIQRHYIISLPLRDREVVSLRDKIYHPQLTYMTSQSLPNTQICCLCSDRIYLVYLLLRNGWHSISLSYV